MKKRLIWTLGILITVTLLPSCAMMQPAGTDRNEYFIVQAKIIPGQANNLIGLAIGAAVFEPGFAQLHPEQLDFDKELSVAYCCDSYRAAMQTKECLLASGFVEAVHISKPDE